MRACKSCSAELEEAALACPRCHTLVHAEALQSWAAQAKAFEQQGQLAKARACWEHAFSLLPRESTQAEWVLGQLNRLAPAPKTAAQAEARNRWAAKLGPLAPVALALAKAKVLLAIFKLNFLVSLAAFMGVYWSLYGKKFGLGFAALILIHELGHFIDVKRRGLPAEMPVFLPGLGAYVRWQAMGVSGVTRAAVSLAGPLAGCLAAAGCSLLWWVTGNGLWAALARAGAWLNVLNLIPVWALDGGQAAAAMDKTGRLALLTGCLALWLVLGQNVFCLVAIGAGYRLFTKDMPSQPSHAITAYFLCVLACLGLVMWMMPGKGFGLG